MLKVAADVTPLLTPRTGIGVFVGELLTHLAPRNDLALTGYAVSWRGRDRLAESVPDGVAVASRPMAARPLHQVWMRTDHPLIDRWIGRHDVVWGTNYVVPPTKAPALVSIYDLTPVRFPELANAHTRTFPALIRRAIRRGAAVHTMSHFVQAEIVEQFGISPDRVHVVPGGVRATPPVAGPGAGSKAGPEEPGEVAGPGGDPGGADEESVQPAAADRAAAEEVVAHRSAQRSEAEVADAAAARGAVERLVGGDRYVLALGTVEPRKDLPTLVAAFDLLAADDPDLRLVIAGQDGWGAEALTSAIDSASFGGRIVRVGWVAEEDRPALLGGAAVYAYPSLYEGFGFPPLEAMSVGIPVVATDAGSLPEVCGDGALLVPPRDADALAKALGQALGDDATRADLIRRGHENVGRYPWDTAADQFATLLHTVAGP